MAITYDEICKHLDNLNLNYTRKKDYIKIGFETENYKNANGDNLLGLCILLEEDNEYFKLFAPNSYNIKNCRHKFSVYQAFMMIQWQTKLIQFEFDKNDGEIRPIIEFPLEDNTVTLKQLYRVIRGIVAIIDDYDPVIRKAMETGVVEFPKSQTEHEIEQYLSILRSLTPDEIRQLIEEIRRKKSVRDNAPESL